MSYFQIAAAWIILAAIFGVLVGKATKRMRGDDE